MSETHSTMLPLGTLAPNFTLPDTVSGKQLALREMATQKGTVIMFICNHCPYVRLILPKLLEVVTHYQTLGIQFIAISSNDSLNYPQDAPDKMREQAIHNHFTFPYLYDEDQSVAKAYQAACTPDFYIFDEQLACVYRGRFDDATPGNGKQVTGADFRFALDNLLDDKPISQQQMPSVGCNIKWKK